MKLELRNRIILDQFQCELTDTLDQLGDITKDNDSIIRHYIIIEKELVGTQYLTIRVPGGSVGRLEIEDNRIIDITIYPIGKPTKYPRNIDKKLAEFIGQPLEID